MAQQSFRRWLLILAVLGAGLDQITKYTVFWWLYDNPKHYNAAESTGSYQIFEGFDLHAQYSSERTAENAILRRGSEKQPYVNQGALFGFGNEHRETANVVFASVSILAGIAIVLWSFRRTASGDLLLCMALGLILAGTMGNLYDRLVFNGVRDFLYWHKVINWPVFNVADCCLVCGAFLLLAQAFLAKPLTDKHAVPAESHTLPLQLPAPEVAAMNQ
jgi:lipoprotein signal peptidase